MGTNFNPATDSLEAISDVVSSLDLNNVATLANQTTQGLVPLATSAQAVDIMGAGFDTATDSLEAISDTVDALNLELDGVATSTQSDTIIANQTSQGTGALATSAQAADILLDTAVIGTAVNTGGTATIGAILGDAANVSLATRLTTIDTVVDDILVDTGTTLPAQIAVLGSSALATSAQAVDILGTNVTTTVIAGADTGYTTNTNDLTAISQGLSSIKGTGFAPSSDSLRAISTNTTAVPLATSAQAGNILANQTSQGTGALATAAALSTTNTTVNTINTNLGDPTGATTIAGNIGDPINNALATSLALVLGDPTVSTGAASIAAAIGNPVGASLSADLLAMQGATFATGTDSLEAISNNNISVPFATAANLATLQTTANTINTNVTTLGTAALATSAQAVDILGTNVTTTVIAGADAGYTTDTNDLTAISQGLSSIKGTGFAPATDSLKIISDNQTSQGTSQLATAANLLTTNTTVNTTNTTVNTINGKIGNLFNTGGEATIGAILGNALNVSFATRLTTIDTEVGVIDGIVDDILVDTGTTLPAQIAVLGSSALATSAQAVSILANQTSQGTGALVTSAQAVDILGTNATTIVIAGADAGYTTDTNDLTAISQGLSSIKGTGFAPATDSLKIISDNQTTQGLVALATNAQAVSILANQTSQGTGALATSAQAADILVDTAVIGTAVNTGGVATIGGILGDPGADTAALSISASLGGIEGATFDTATDSLEAISDKIGSPVNTGAGADTLAGILGDPGASTPSASTSIAAALGGIEGASFTTALASLYIIAGQVAVGQVLAAGNSAVLALPVVNLDITDDTFNASMVIVFDNLRLALVTPSNGTITTLNTSVDTAITNAAALTEPLTSAYPKSAVQAAVQELKTAVTSWLAFYP